MHIENMLTEKVVILIDLDGFRTCVIQQLRVRDISLIISAFPHV